MKCGTMAGFITPWSPRGARAGATKSYSRGIPPGAPRGPTGACNSRKRHDDTAGRKRRQRWWHFVDTLTLVTVPYAGLSVHQSLGIISLSVCFASIRRPLSLCLDFRFGLPGHSQTISARQGGVRDHEAPLCSDFGFQNLRLHCKTQLDRRTPANRSDRRSTTCNRNRNRTSWVRRLCRPK